MTAIRHEAPHRRPFGASLAKVAALVPGWSDVGYALHASLCALATLWLAVWLQLGAPYWAASTVLITSQASRSQGLMKGINRLIGTAVGTIVGVALIGLDPQGWWGYLGVHTAWLALCTFVSCLLKDLQSYAAALAGYTALIVAIGSFGEPARSFDVAVSRGSAVVLGVTLFMVTLHLVTPSNDAPDLRRKLAGWLDDGLALSARLLRREAGTDDVVKVLGAVAGFDSVVEGGATEAAWIAPRKPLLRGAVLALGDCVMLCAAAARSENLDVPARQALGAELDHLRPGQPSFAASGNAPARGGDDAPKCDILLRALVARDGLEALRRDGFSTRRDPVARIVDRDAPRAGYAALRALIGMGLASTVWIVTRWPSGGDFVEVTGILCCLLASRPSPIGNARDFTISTIGTAVVALIIGFFVLPVVSGFGWLAAALFPALLAGALGVRSKKFGGYFTPLNFFLMSMIGIENQMSYDPLNFFNSVAGLVAGALFATLMFQLMPPPTIARQARALRRRMEAGAAAGYRNVRNSAEARSLYLQRLGTLTGMVDDAVARRLVDEAIAEWPRRLGNRA